MVKRNEKKKNNKDSFISSVISELKMVSWTPFKDIFKYTFATLLFCLVLSGYFAFLNLALSFVKGLFV